MKKLGSTLLTGLLVLGLTAGTALAKPEHAGKPGNGANPPQAAASKNADKGKPEDKGNPGKGNDKKDNKPAGSVSSAVYGNDSSASVTDAVYGSGKGPQGYKGLLNAINHTKDKPAGSVIANLLLTKYPDRLTPELTAELEGIKASRDALSKAAELLAKNGSVTDAVYMQQEAVLADVTDLDGYITLDKLSRQAGEKQGKKLFVNGVRYQGTTPVVTNGTTLVPFRTVSEALQADVSYNPANKTVTVKRGSDTVVLYLNSKKALVNGKAVSLQTAAVVKSGVTLVPIRLVSEALGATVKWEPESQSVIVYEESSASAAAAE
ncbi:copper amine oxidase N-terminal domain-containing protein [Paenibacillus sp. JX-17]|uniref:Copper amine oxidase N-terminal domain-containing protein n=1 Tax=Paenibacillus lacisoli TaxID=3064525 RepID=A0ABT9CC30_9BACL|nr:copper amine oxidase N-terminal domain-containing protein [Paenibacillus sp. JX-17]MDO7906811.1 copper amine oxidase N-terminal domain-containing protein [Paenibacillus sp. JX-17]